MLNTSDQITFISITQNHNRSSAVCKAEQIYRGRSLSTAHSHATDWQPHNLQISSTEYLIQVLHKITNSCFIVHYSTETPWWHWRKRIIMRGHALFYFFYYSVYYRRNSFISWNVEKIRSVFLFTVREECSHLTGWQQRMEKPIHLIVDDFLNNCSTQSDGFISFQGFHVTDFHVTKDRLNIDSQTASDLHTCSLQ